MALAEDACRWPKPVHGQWANDASPARAIPSKFWAHDGEDESDDEALVEKQSPSTPEFIVEALDAGFTVDQLARAEKALASSNVPSSGDRLLPNSIVAKMVERKLAGAPWQGPLPSPRVSPPRTLGDCVSKARILSAGAPGALASSPRRPRSPTERYEGDSAGARGALASSSKRPSLPARSPPARYEGNSKIFESSNLRYSDPDFLPLSLARPLVELTACSARVATGKSDRASLKIVIGPGKVFRPTQGLCALFRRTGTRKIKKTLLWLQRCPSRTWSMKGR